MVRLPQGVSCERVGDSWLVLCDRDGVVHNLTGPAATVIDCVTTSQPIPPDCDDATLVDAGVLTAPTGWSRRKVLAAGGAAAAVGMVTLTLPTAAMASSLGPFGTVTATAGANQVTIDWDAVADTSYQVFYKFTTDDDSNYQSFGGSVAAGPVIVTGLTNGIGYSFKVQVVGSSIESSVVTATPSATPIVNLGVTWTAVVPVAGVPQAGDWRSVAYGNGVWVAVANNETNRVMYSTNDGLNWTAVGAPAGVTANKWTSVAYGNGVWVAVAEEGTNRVMYSTNGGLNWAQPVAAPEANSWTSVAHGNGVWVAVANSGTNRVMTSPDGQTWTARTAAEANFWKSVAYGNGVWVAVAEPNFESDNLVMFSTNNGANWTAVGAPAVVAANTWRSVAYGNGVWVAVAGSSFGGNDQVMRSDTGGVSWTSVSPPAPLANNAWNSVAYGNGVWVAVAGFSMDGGPDHAMFSADNGASWTAASGVEQKQWNSVAYGNGKFVAVANAENDRVMYSPAPGP